MAYTGAYADRWSDEARSLWREACAATRRFNAWTRTPPDASVRLLAALSELDEPVGGTALAEHAGVHQGNATGAHLPRLAEMGLVDWTLGEPTRRGARPPKIWWITDAGRRMAEALAEGRQ